LLFQQASITATGWLLVEVVAVAELTVQLVVVVVLVDSEQEHDSH
jgi:hypothetical protein